VNALHDKRHTKAEHDTADHGLGGELGHGANGAGQSDEKPEQPGGDSRGEKCRRGDTASHGRSADGLHGLDGNRGLIDEAGRDLA